MLQTTIAPARRKVFIISRCARTLFTFRLELIKSIAASGAQVIALGAGGDGFDRRLKENGIDFRAIPVSMRSLNPLADGQLLWSLVKIMAAERPSVVHCFTIKPAIYGVIAARVCRVPCRVATITGLGYSFTSANSLLTKVVSVLYRMALGHAHVVYFQNRDDLSLFTNHKLVNSSIARLVPGSGVDLQRFAPQGAPRTVHPRRFLMIARLLYEKGIREYITAAARVSITHPTAEFVLVGAQDLRNPTSLSTSEISSLRDSRIVRWVGEVDDVRKYIAESDVVVLPSYREGVPRALLEGAAMEKPLLASDAPGCRDVVVEGATGFLVPIRDSDALAATMRRFVEMPDDELQRMGRAARAHVQANFDEQLVIRDICATYDQVLGEAT